MIINHNMMAANALRNSSINQGAASKSMEKLSSGLRINRAGDDAAGLSISEKMRAQIRGLEQASTNAQDGISLIQTAEGALNETHNILQRMRELSVQASNDTNIDTDRAAIQEEMDALGEEITRIAKDTEFNKQSLLDGGFNGSFQIGANESQSIKLGIDKMDSASLGLTSGIVVKESQPIAADKLADGIYTIEGDKLLDSKGNQVGTLTKGDNKITANGEDVQFGTAKINDKATVTVKDGQMTIENTFPAAKQDDLKKLAAGTYTVTANNVLKDGELIGEFNGGTITLKDGTTLDKDALGFKEDIKAGDEFTIKGIDIADSKKATASITQINNAIEKVSTQRSQLGAVQNRLEHTISNLDTSSENLTSAESRIRDVNMAKEMSTFSKNNILQQAAQAMLSQANQQPQNVLQLLR